MTPMTIDELIGLGGEYIDHGVPVFAIRLEQEADRIARRTAELFEVVDRLSRRSLEHTLAAIVELELEQRRALTRLNPDFFSRYPGGVDVHARVEALTRSQQNPGWESWLPDFLGRYRSRLRGDDPVLLASVCHGALQGVVDRLSWPPRDAAAGPDTARAELLFLLLGYLLATPPSMDDCERFFGELGTAADSPAGRDAAGDAQAGPR